jgi:hypothetical protein
MKPAAKKITGLALLALAIIAAVTLFVLPGREKDREEQARGLLAAIGLKAENVKASFFGNSIVFTKVSGDFHLESLEMSYSLDVEEVTASGLNFLAGQQKGVVSLADSLVFSNISFSNILKNMIKTDGACKKISLSGIRLDLGALLERMRDATSMSPPEIAALMLGDVISMSAPETAALLEPLRTLRLDRAVYADYRLNQDMDSERISLHFDSAEIRNMGLLDAGPMSMKNITAESMGMKVTAGRLDLARLVIPEAYLLLAPVRPEDVTGRDILDLLDKDPFILEGFSLRDMNVSVPFKETVSVAGLTLDFGFSADMAGLGLALDGMAMPFDLVEPEGSILVSGNLDGALKREGGEANLAFSGSLETKGLGGVALSGDLTLGSGPDLPAVLERADFRARSLALSLKDYGLLQKLAGSGFASTDFLLQMAGETAEELGELPFDDVPGILPALEAFVRQSGSLNFSLRAEPPFPLENFNFYDHFKTLAGQTVTLSVEHKKPWSN